MTDEPTLAEPGRTLLLAWLATAVADGIFASALTLSGTPPTVAGEWQAIAATVFGAHPLGSGTSMVLLGVAIHFGVALWWSVIFVALVRASRSLRAMLVRPGGALAIAAVYGPVVWLVMSGVAIPIVTHHLPRISDRWWLLLAGHIVFVGLPMALVVAHRLRGRR